MTLLHLERERTERQFNARVLEELEIIIRLFKTALRANEWDLEIGKGTLSQILESIQKPENAVRPSLEPQAPRRRLTQLRMCNFGTAETLLRFYIRSSNYSRYSRRSRS